MQHSIGRTVWFYRHYQEFTGGHLKHSHYFNSLKSHPDYNPRIIVENKAPLMQAQQQIHQLWGGELNTPEQWAPKKNDVIFLAGMDWSFALAKGGFDSTMPRLNLIQGTRHADPAQLLYQYLAEPAIRLCVSQPVADAIIGTGKVNGPVFVIPNGIDCQPNQNLVSISHTFSRVQIVGYKMPDFARVLAQKLSAAGIATDLLLNILPRDEFIEMLDPAALVVCCPLPAEGFYLTALEAMAKGCFVVVPDCEGNRAYAVDGVNCLFPDYQHEAVFNAIARALVLPQGEIVKIRQAAVVTAMKHTLESERLEFYKLLNNIDQLWQEI